MKKITTYVAGLLALAMTYLTMSLTAQAQVTGGPTPGGNNGVQEGLNTIGQAYPNGARNNVDVGQLIHLIINWALYIAAIAAVIFIIIGGYQYITSAGNDAQAKKGRQTLQNALIGLVIVVLSYMIVQVVYNFLVS